MKQKYYAGMGKYNSQGLWMEIIEYISNKNIQVKFEDGYIKKTNCDSFKKGTVRNPNYKKNYHTMASKRIGLVKQNDLGETMKVIAYNSAYDVTVEFQDEYKGTINVSWKQWKNGKIQNPNKKLTGIIKHPINFIDLTGKIFNNLKVLYWDTNPPIKYKDQEGTGLWKCECLLCGNYVWGKSYAIASGTLKYCQNCGVKAKAKKKKENKYDLSGDYGIGWTYNTNTPFYFDKEDYDKIKDFAWKEDSNHYITTHRNNKYILMHRLIMGVIDSKIHIDHIKHNKNDNRKSQLRQATCKENVRNKMLAKNNTSGITGVNKEGSRWRAYIWVDGKTIHLGTYKNKKDAIEARIKAENDYFGEFGIHNSMKIGD